MRVKMTIGFDLIERNCSSTIKKVSLLPKEQHRAATQERYSNCAAYRRSVIEIEVVDDVSSLVSLI